MQYHGSIPEGRRFLNVLMRPVAINEYPSILTHREVKQSIAPVRMWVTHIQSSMCDCIFTQWYGRAGLHYLMSSSHGVCCFMGVYQTVLTLPAATRCMCVIAKWRTMVKPAGQVLWPSAAQLMFPPGYITQQAGFL